MGHKNYRLRTRCAKTWINIDELKKEVEKWNPKRFKYRVERK